MPIQWIYLCREDGETRPFKPGGKHYIRVLADQPAACGSGFSYRMKVFEAVQIASPQLLSYEALSSWVQGERSAGRLCMSNL